MHSYIKESQFCVEPNPSHNEVPYDSIRSAAMQISQISPPKPFCVWDDAVKAPTPKSWNLVSALEEEEYRNLETIKS